MKNGSLDDDGSREARLQAEGEPVVVTRSALSRQRRLQKLAEKFGTLDGFMDQEALRRTREDS